MKWIFALWICCCGCISPLATFQGSSTAHDVVIEELRTEIADVKHSLHAKEVEFRLLEETVEASGLAKADELRTELMTLRQKIAQLEKTQEKTAADLRALSTHATQTAATLSQYRDHIQEIDRRVEEGRNLKPYKNSGLSYVVKPGDTLKKIANRYQVSVDSLQQLNHLEDDHIFVGQKLKIHE
jgi:LysM repeat protein